MAATVARDARSTDGGAISASKRVVTIGITARGKDLLTVTTRRQDITVTTHHQDITVTTHRVIRADCIPL